MSPTQILGVSPRVHSRSFIFSPKTSVDFQVWPISVFASQTPEGSHFLLTQLCPPAEPVGKGPTRLACRALYRSLSSNPQRAGRVLPKLGDGVIRALTPDLKVVGTKLQKQGNEHI